MVLSDLDSSPILAVDCRSNNEKDLERERERERERDKGKNQGNERRGSHGDGISARTKTF